jgi:metal-sulfur cluster biosynthetic enzyme
MIRNIEDPEHPLTLEQLRVVSLEQVSINNQRREVEVSFTPTIPHCSSASIIGLMIRTKLGRGLPENYKVKRYLYRLPCL